MASYQDLDIRVKIIEDKVALILQLIRVTKRTPSTLIPGEFVVEELTGEDLYKEIQAKGGVIANG